MPAKTATKPEARHQLGALVDVFVEQCNVTIPRGIVATRRLSKDGVWWYIVNCESLKIAAREQDVTAHQA